MILLTDEARIFRLSSRSIINKGFRRVLFLGIDFSLTFALVFTLRGLIYCGRLDNMYLRGFARTG